MNTVNFGKMLRILRKQKKMTQDELASMLGITTSAISKWETGKNMPDTGTFQQLSKLLNVSLYELYHPEETLQQLTAASMESPFSSEYSINTSTPQKEASSADINVQIPTQKTVSYKPRKFIFAALILFCLFFAGLLIYFYRWANTAQSILPVAFRIAEDEKYGMVYEMACIHSGDLEQITLTDSFTLQLSEDWINNTGITSEITVMKVSFYTDAETAKQWRTPQKAFYLIR